MKGLTDSISVSVVHPVMPAESWTFSEDYPGTTGDRIHDFRMLAELYQRADPTFDGLVTVPVLDDIQRDTIVNNESSEIIRMLNHAFDALDALEARLAQQRDLVGATLTGADWRLFFTLVRCDAVYYSHFKCNRQRLTDHPNPRAYTREL